jgi:hypothetical protein
MSRITKSERWSRIAVLVVVTALAWSQPRTASAWHGRWWGGSGPRAWCGPVFGPRVYGGWGGWYGGTRFAYSNSVYLGGPFGGFFSGGVRSFVVGGPGWCGPAWYGPAWGGCYGWPCTYYPTFSPVGCGWGWQPIVVSPFVGSIAPTFGPAGVLPYMGFGFANAGTPASRGMNPAMHAAVAASQRPVAAAPPLAARPPAATIAIRSSNGDSRLRAGKLVAVGDRHLRNAVHDASKLAAALDAYRRAATIAPDLPDTFLRQAIVLTALDRDADAARSVERAVAIDARLGPDAAAALAARDRLPPDPVFGERPDAGPMGLESHGRNLLARIFTVQPADGAAAPGLNWIADRWSRRLGGADGAVRAEAVAAK